MKDIKSLTKLEMIDMFVKNMNEPKFRAEQLYEWLYEHNAQSFDEMTSLSKSIREKLKQNFYLNGPMVVDEQRSKDGTVKLLLEFHDGAQVETVAMPSYTDDSKLTVCVSTQAGCPLNCSFCATGKGGFIRNLTNGEITDQVALAGKVIDRRVSNVVFMGQGEPFLNYDNTMHALRVLNDEKAFNIGARKMTVSTSGIIEGIDSFAEEPEQFELAISLHSAIQNSRNLLMPGLKKWPLKDLRAALKRYNHVSNRRFTVEVALMSEINDTNEEIIALKDFCMGLHCHINLIELNKISESIFKPSSRKRMEEIATYLRDSGLETTIRTSRGNDISAACGQLTQEHSKD